MSLQMCLECGWFGPEAELCKGDCPKCKDGITRKLRLYMCRECGHMDTKDAFRRTASPNVPIATLVRAQMSCPECEGAAEGFYEVTEQVYDWNKKLIADFVQAELEEVRAENGRRQRAYERRKQAMQDDLYSV